MPNWEVGEAHPDFVFNYSYSSNYWLNARIENRVLVEASTAQNELWNGMVLVTPLAVPSNIRCEALLTLRHGGDNDLGTGWRIASAYGDDWYIHETGVLANCSARDEGGCVVTVWAEERGGRWINLHYQEQVEEQDDEPDPYGFDCDDEAEHYDGCECDGCMPEFGEAIDDLCHGPCCLPEPHDDCPCQDCTERRGGPPRSEQRDVWVEEDSYSTRWRQYTNGGIAVFVLKPTQSDARGRRVIVRASDNDDLTWFDNGEVECEGAWHARSNSWRHGALSDCNVYRTSHDLTVYVSGDQGRSELRIDLDLNVTINGGPTRPEPRPEPLSFLTAEPSVVERKPLRARRDYGKLILGRAWGVEIEYNRPNDHEYHNPCNYERLAEVLKDKGLAVHAEGWAPSSRREFSEWVCSTDSTVSGGECKSPILRGADTINDVRTVMRTIRELGGKVDHRCGTHVHHDVNDLERRELQLLIDNLAASYDALMTYIPADRQENDDYCPPNRVSELRTLWRYAANGSLRKGGSGVMDRYRAFNFESVMSYGSVEFRAHPGTLDARLLEPWVAAGMALVEFSRRQHEFGRKVCPQELMETFVNERLIHVDLAKKFLARTEALYGEVAITNPPLLLSVA